MNRHAAWAAIVALLAAWMVRVLQVTNKGRDTIPPPFPPATVLYGPWADHGPNCKCNVCR